MKTILIIISLFICSFSFSQGAYYRFLTTDTVKASSASGLFLLDDSGTKGVFVSDGGFVGINNVSPSVNLDVTGSMRSSGSVSSGTYVFLSGDVIQYSTDTYTDVYLQTDKSNGNQTLHVVNDDPTYILNVEFENDIYVNNNFILDSLKTIGDCETVADEDSIIIVNVAGVLEVWVNEGTNDQYLNARLYDDGSITVLKTNGTASAADADGFLCVIDRGTNAVIKNRLGSQLKICYELKTSR